MSCLRPGIVRARHSRQRGGGSRSGFTLLELMIAVSILSILVVGVLESLTRQQRTSIVTESVVEVQNNVRAIASLVEREIRMAGYMVPDAAAVCGIDSTSGGDELFVSENEPIVPDDARAGDMGARLGAGAGAWANPTINSSNRAASTPVALVLDSTMSDLDGDGSYFYDNDGNGAADSDFRIGGGFILADMANPHRGSLCGIVNATTPAAMTMVPMSGGLAALVATDAEEEIVIVPAARYALDATGRLTRNGELLALGVDDFQVSYYYDVDDDGVVDSAATEEPGTKDGSAYDPAAWDNQDLREIRFSIVVRTRAADQNFDDGDFVTLENRAAPAGGNDGFRRRVIVGSIRPRNVGNAGSI